MSDDGIQVWAPMEVVEALLARAEKAEAAIQRVRDIQQRYVSVSRDEMSQTDALGAIGRVLDGERDE